MGAERTVLDDGPAAMMTITEAADLLHVHLSTLRRWEKAGWLQSTRIGPRGHRRYSREVILALVQRAARVGDGPAEA